MAPKTNTQKTARTTTIGKRTKPEAVPTPEQREQAAEQTTVAQTPGNEAPEQVAPPELPALPRMKRAPKAKTHECACGCGGHTANRFLPGHDSKLRGWVLRVQRGIITIDSIAHAGTRQAVERELQHGPVEQPAQEEKAS